MNAHLINAQPVTVSQIVGHKRQLYKLIEAIPVRFLDMQGVQLMNQSDNTQINLQQYNNDTYILEKSNRDASSNIQINTQSSGSDYNNTINNKLKCTCHLGKEQFLTKKEMLPQSTYETAFSRLFTSQGCFLILTFLP